VLAVYRVRPLCAPSPTRHWLRSTGGVWWDADETSASARARHADEVARGYDSHLLTGEDVAGAFPGVDAGAVIGEAVVNPGEGWVSLPHLVEHLAAELRERGGEIRTELGGCALLVEDGRAVGIRDASGAEHRADAVVVACGAGTSAVMAGAGVDIPDEIGRASCRERVEVAGGGVSWEETSVS